MAKLLCAVAPTLDVQSSFHPPRLDMHGAVRAQVILLAALLGLSLVVRVVFLVGGCCFDS